MNRPDTEAAPSHLTWHLPLRRDRITLAQARADLARVGAAPQDIPLMVQLVENPRYRIPGLDLFHGRVALHQHDAIHILLGRGLLNKDEAFTIGFTMGSTRQVSTIEEELFARIAGRLYPKPYQFDSNDLEVFRDAVRLAFVCHCQALDGIDFDAYADQPLATIRRHLGIDKRLLLAYYRLEKQRYPQCPASRRLLDR